MKTYKNPFAFKNQWSENEFGDPFIMRFNGMYYLYCSSAGDHIKCWVSENLIDFDYVGSVCDETAIYGAYAPEVCYYKGNFYMITSPVGSGHYLLMADKPTGPFRLISDNYGLLIDGSFYIDDDGKQYMLRAGHNGIIIHSMPFPDEINVNGTLIPESYLNYWTEGPMIIKRNGYYYLTYTGNHLHSKGYRIAYSVSKTDPTSGYVNLKNQTLLLETGPEFHGLGHSSSFLAPDLDSYCIAYHNFDLDRTPRKRSSNIDRLFFNGARMYCNPIWWEQDGHKMPEFWCRGNEKLNLCTVEQKNYLMTPMETKECYTTEINVDAKGEDISFLYGYKNNQYGTVVLRKDSTYEIKECGNLIETGTVNQAVSMETMVTLRFARKFDSYVDIYINNMFLCTYKTQLTQGYIGIEENLNQEIGFIGYSESVGGCEDKYAKKAIPGRFDAIHCIEDSEFISFYDAGMEVYSALFKKNERYTYKVNVKKTGCYKVIARVLGSKERICIKAVINETEITLNGQLSGTCDEEGYEIISFGTLDISQDFEQIILFTESNDITIDYFEFVEHSSIEALTVIKDGYLVTDQLKILGHKGPKSMIHKYSGFTCAENLGMAFIGEDGLSDYNILASINGNNKPTGDVSIYVRATKESWFPAQVKESLFGYCIKVSYGGIHLYRVQYGEELLEFYSIRNNRTTMLELNIHVKNSTIQVFLNNQLIITYVDPTPFVFGKIGLNATGEGFGFDNFSVYYD
jgi:xylan 1,4-beta-xylosidase